MTPIILKIKCPFCGMEIYQEIQPFQFDSHIVFECYHEDLDSVNHDVTGCLGRFIAYVSPEVTATEIQKVHGRVE